MGCVIGYRYVGIVRYSSINSHARASRIRVFFCGVMFTPLGFAPGSFSNVSLLPLVSVMYTPLTLATGASAFPPSPDDLGSMSLLWMSFVRDVRLLWEDGAVIPRMVSCPGSTCCQLPRRMMVRRRLSAHLARTLFRGNIVILTKYGVETYRATHVFLVHRGF